MSNEGQGQQACAVPIDEQCASTLEHYERLATLAHEWNNQVPQAIKAWYEAKTLSSAGGSLTLPQYATDAMRKAIWDAMWEYPHWHGDAEQIKDADRVYGAITAFATSSASRSIADGLEPDEAIVERAKYWALSANSVKEYPREAFQLFRNEILRIADVINGADAVPRCDLLEEAAKECDALGRMAPNQERGLAYDIAAKVIRDLKLPIDRDFP